MSIESTDSNFQCPTGYVKESVAPQLFYEDLDEESEIWLIRIPHDLNPSVIENQRIILDGYQHILDCDENSRFEYISDSIKQPRLSMILPQKSNGKLKSVKKEFKGSIFFNEDILLENSAVKMEEDNANANILNISSSFLMDDFEKSISIQDNSNSLVESKKSKKKRSSSVKIKKEKTSDVDDFPACNSQK